MLAYVNKTQRTKEEAVEVNNQLKIFKSSLPVPKSHLEYEKILRMRRTEKVDGFLNEVFD